MWTNKNEIDFFKQALKNFSSPEQLFYRLNSGYYAYIPKGEGSENQVLQSRNSLIGSYTEKWCKEIFTPIASELKLFALNGVQCEELELTSKSPADLAFCSTNSINQTAENIKLIVEIKMSIVSNYKFELDSKKIENIGDYKSHKGNPSLLRSDSILKAIGKSLNIRISCNNARKIPIIIVGNSPITENYSEKVDLLKSSGVIQGFISMNQNPTTSPYIIETPQKGFRTYSDYKNLKDWIFSLLTAELNYFSSMISKKRLGEIIQISNLETDLISKAEKFLSLLD
ncbi:MAG: hypothetical protein AB7T10_05030 [bacterium]